MVTRWKRFWQGKRGASLVEFALVLPVLVLFMAGVWEFGRIYDSYLVATNAAREGARWAALGYDDAAVQARVNAYLNSGYAARISSGELTVGSVTMALLTDPDNGYNTPGAPGAPVQVTVPIAVEMFMPGVLGTGVTFPIAGQATMRLQAQGNAVAGPPPAPTATPTPPPAKPKPGGPPTKP